jgi:hypothetical protein
MPRHEGVRVTWWELVDLWLPDELIQDTVLPAIVAECVRTFAEWARARMRRARQEEADRQAAPQHLTIFGPNGKPLKTMLVEGEDEEPQVKDPGEHDAERPRP